jgi:Na+/H+-dicarboxylate symporter
MKILRKLPLYVKILLGMLLGVIVGYLFLLIGQAAFVTDWLKPWGTIFIKLLKLIAVPLVFISLIKGVTGMKDIKKLSEIGLKTISIYIFTTFIAVSFGLGMVNLIKPGNFFPRDKAEQYKEQFFEKVSSNVDSAQKLKNTSVMDFVVDIVPENIFAASSDNSKMLQIIFFAILVGIALVILGHKHTAIILPIVDSVDAIILKIVDLIMDFAPFGVMALMAGLIVDFAGDKDMFTALGMYSLTVILSLMILAYIFYPTMIKIFTKIGIKRYLKAIFPIQLLAFSTSSSSATLPFTMEQSQNELGISEEVSSFVLPVGSTINMDGTSCYQVIAIFFIAQIFGIDLTFAQILTIVFLTVLASIGTPGIPGGSIVMTVMVLSSVGIPLEGLALIIGIDRPLDMLRTVVNVTGDTFVASIIDAKK